MTLHGPATRRHRARSVPQRRTRSGPADEGRGEFIGGRPASLDELRERYRRLGAGSSDENEVWLNWIALRSSDAHPVGTVQATLSKDGGRWTAQVAWVIGVDFSARASPPKLHAPSSSGFSAAARPAFWRTSIRITEPPPSSRSEPDCGPPLRKWTARRSGERRRRSTGSTNGQRGATVPRSCAATGARERWWPERATICRVDAARRRRSSGH